MRLKNKVIILTGAAGLVGPIYIKGLLDNGAKVVAVDLSLSKLENLFSKEKPLHNLLFFAGDISIHSTWTDILATSIEHFGKIDCLVNNAAITNQSQSTNYNKNLFDYPIDDWEAIMKVNLTGCFLGCQVIGKNLVENKSGNIVNIASFYGVQSPNHKLYPGTGIFQPPAYMVSKSGVIALTKYLATYFGEMGVRVNSISPGGIFNDHSGLFLERFSNLNPMGRMAQKEEMLGALLYLLSDESSYCNGHNLIVDGGWSAW